MSGRFARAPDLDQFWQNLRDGVEGLSFPTADELRAMGVEPRRLEHPRFVRVMSPLEDMASFDAAFFGYTPREAEVMDPQHRLFLETAWETFEDAGYVPDAIPGDVGVYAGCSLNTYQYRVVAHAELLESIGWFGHMLASDKDFLPTRVSYKFNLRGPSVNVQTACSTSLVAIHMACRALRAGECDMALAGGATAHPLSGGYVYTEGMIMSPDGHCRPFDAQAGGTVGGNGVAAILLKRLDEAIADGDHIYAVIRGTAINNDGSGKVGYTAPSVAGQARVIRAALADAGLEPAAISYVEAHGTATELGDPIEVAALSSVFGGLAPGSVALGSLKSNLGHLDAAAGVGGLIKTVLALTHGALPPSLHFREWNPRIRQDALPFAVNQTVRPWPGPSPRRAGVSSFGIGGTNAHVIVEEAPASTSTDASCPSRPSQIVLLSARSETALERSVERLSGRLRDDAISLADVAYTLAVGRKAFRYRRAVVCRDLAGAVGGTQLLQGDAGDGPPGLAFMFCGQGSQYPGMGRSLHAHEPVFREAFDACAALLLDEFGVDLQALLFGANADAATLQQTCHAQPALFAVEYSLAQLLLTWGLRPEILVGHSVGEYVAACLAGVFSWQDALRLVALRGQLMSRLPAGSMAAVSCAADEVTSHLADGLCVAAVNAPRLTVVSGPTLAVEAFSSAMRARDIAVHELRTSHAFHSSMMDPAVADFVAAVRRVKLSPPTMPVVSNVTGRLLTAEEAVDADYWAAHIKQPVLFSRAVTELLRESRRVVVEVGPGRALGTCVRMHAEASSHVVVSTMPSADDADEGLAHLQRAVATMWCHGADVGWAGYYRHEKRRRVRLPTYPFERQRYWLDEQPSRVMTAGRRAVLERKTDIADCLYVPSWTRSPVGPPAALDSSRWLVLCDAHDRIGPVVARLKQVAADVVCVRAGSNYACVGVNEFQVRASSAADVKRMLATLIDENRAPTHVLHAWSLYGGDDDLAGYAALLHFVQAVGVLGHPQSIEILVLTWQLRDVLGEGVTAPARAAMLGLCRTVRWEFFNVHARCVDFAAPASGGWSEEMLAQVLAECSATERAFDIAWRGAYRWVQNYVPVVTPPPDPGQPPARLKPRGVYLITGGLGGIGLQLAGWLAARLQARLVLTGRRALPPRELWEDIRDAGQSDAALVKKLSALLAMEAAGASVMTAAADVSDEADMSALLERIHGSYGKLDGVFHLAGTEAMGALQLLEQTVTPAIAAKVRGTQLLVSMLANEGLDFMVLWSSISAFLGGLGLGDYAAANAVLDAWPFVADRHEVPIISIGWDVWRQTGMVADTVMPAFLEDRRALMLEQGLTNAEGLEALERILASPYRHVVVCTRDAQHLYQRAVSGAAAPVRSGAATERATGEAPRSLAKTAYVEPASDTERRLADIWQNVLGIASVGVTDDFFDLGGHSLIATQIIARLFESLGVSIPVRSFFENRTVRDMARLVDTIRWTAGSTDASDEDAEEREQVSF
jgi:acyl transferase domain-containing protein/acyl carrier protein